jgi:hypothetical protein
MIQTTKHTLTSAVLGSLLLTAPLALTVSAFAQSGSDIQMPKREVPSGTPVKVKLLRDINSESAQTGDHVKVEVASDDSSGLPTGTVLNGVITSVRQATPKTAGVLFVRFGTGRGGSSSSFNLATGEFQGKKQSSDKSNYTSIGAGAGALLGFARKRKLGDAIGGALLGGGAGYAANAAQKHSASDIDLKSGSEVTIKTTRPLTLQTQIISDY